MPLKLKPRSISVVSSSLESSPKKIRHSACKRYHACTVQYCTYIEGETEVSFWVCGGGRTNFWVSCPRVASCCCWVSLSSWFRLIFFLPPTSFRLSLSHHIAPETPLTAQSQIAPFVLVFLFFFYPCPKCGTVWQNGINFYCRHITVVAIKKAHQNNND